VDVHRRRWYASLEIDLWRTSYDLSEQGQQLAHDRIIEAAEEFYDRGGRGSLSFGSGPTYTYVSRVFNDQVEPLLDDLLGIIEANLVPYRSLAQRRAEGAS
jgi:hypothetical protein